MAIVLRNDAKEQIMNMLKKQGYPTYAHLVSFFNIYLTDNPKVIGYMEPGKAVIVLNKNLLIDQVSTIIRHEILHEYLTHMQRQKKVDDEDGSTNHELANIAGDYEISNKGYTDSDKRIARSIRLGDERLVGLVTEYDHPEWVDMSFEEMYRELKKQASEDESKISRELSRSRSVSQKDLEDLEDAIASAKDQAEQESEEAETSGDEEAKAEAEASTDKLTELEKETQKAKKKQKEITASQDGPFGDEEDAKAKSDIAHQVEEIRKALEDARIRDALHREATEPVEREKAAKEAENIRKVQADPLQRFKLTLNKFIANELEVIEDQSYLRMHPSYEETDFIMPGKYSHEHFAKPSINVYWDISGSFNTAEKTEGARSAIATLNKYEKRGQIKMRTKFFAKNVSDNRSDVNTGWTLGMPIIRDIQADKPDNVIIITDDDITDCTEEIVVPGAVWLLFYDAESENLKDHIRGRKQTKHYFINKV